MPSRRTFLTSLGILAGTALPRSLRAARAAVVEAEATVFFGHPDGATCLVRFHVMGVDAPAGRLRVYDGRNRLVGTAGVLQRGGRLYGELWLPIQGDTRIRSELEAPGVRGVFRTAHRLRPARRWTLHWVTVADAAIVGQRLAASDPIRLAVERVVLSASSVMGNPLSGTVAPDLLETSELLRIAEAAGRLERDWGIPASSVAVLESQTSMPPTIVTALTGSGVRYAVERRNDGPLLRWLEGPGDARVLAAAVPASGDSRSLGFGGPSPEMARRVEQWLTTTPLLLSPESPLGTEGVAFVVDTVLPDHPMRVSQQIEEWNRQYAYPRIAVGASEELERLFGASQDGSVPVARVTSTARESLPGLARLGEIAARREAQRARYALEAALPLAGAVDAADSPLEGVPDVLTAVGRHIGTGLPGTLVFNPAPFLRTDAVAFPDGTTHVVTSVPPTGYAFVVATDPAEDPDLPVETLEVSGAVGRLRIDATSGAIDSLVDVEGTEWVRAAVAGLNAVPGAILERWSAARLADVGTRYRLQRWSPEWGEVQTTVTVYDTLPWIDIENNAAALGNRPMEYYFAFVLPAPEVLWEIPAGSDRGAPPRRRLAHGRWICLQNREGSALLRPYDAAFASVMDDGTLVSHAPGGRSRYRVQVSGDFQDAGSCALFGWSGEPLVAVPAVGSPAGRLPRHGSLVYVPQPGVAVVGLRPDPDGTGVIVHVQELLGRERFVSLVGEVLTFAEAREVDFLGRPLGNPLEIAAESVVIRVPPAGVTAVWLGEIGIRGG